jgi:hypothetical protein
LFVSSNPNFVDRIIDYGKIISQGNPKKDFLKSLMKWLKEFFLIHVNPLFIETKFMSNKQKKKQWFSSLELSHCFFTTKDSTKYDANLVILLTVISSFAIGNGTR